MELRVRPARPADRPAMVAIKHDAGLSAWGHILPLTVIETLPFPDRWVAAIETSAPRVTMQVAEADGRVVGFALARPSGDPDADDATGELDGLYVGPDSWGLGAGRALLAAAVASLRAAQFREATLWTAAENHRPRRIYEIAGWQVDGTQRRRTFGGVEYTEVRYRLPLGEDA